MDLHNRGNKTRKLQVLKDLNNTLQLHAERMKLSSRYDPTAPPARVTSGISHSTASNLDNHLISHTDHDHPLSGGHIGKRSPRLSRIPVPDQHGDTVVTNPVSPARRRRHARDVVKNYRPGYTWNMGGRLKELKIRYIARKYLELWKLKTFGRILPSVARQHYAIRAYRKVFDILHNDWWTNRREWRLNVRADCHDRYRLWNKCWKKWKFYTQIQKQKRLQQEKADTHYNTMILTKSLLTWQLYAVKHRNKKSLQMKAEQQHQLHCQRMVWRVWRERFSARQALKDMDTQANHFRDQGLVIKFWRMWRAKLEQQKLARDNQSAAETLYRRSLMKQSWRSIVMYVNLRKAKYVQYAEASNIHKVKLMMKFMAMWRTRLEQKYQVREKESSIIELSVRSRCRRIISHWKHYIELKHQERDIEEESDQHYIGTIMGRCLTALKLAVVQRGVKTLRNEQAEEYYNRSLTRRTWDAWLVRCDQCEELKLFHLTKRAQAHHRSKLSQLAFEHWKYYLILRRDKHSEEMRADIHYSSILIPKYFSYWGRFVEHKQWKLETKEQAAQQFRSSMAAKYFYLWQTAYERSMENRTMERVALVHHEEQLRRRFLTAWRLKTAAVLDDYENMTLAADHHRLRTLKSTFNRWKIYVNENLQEDEQTCKAQEFRQNHILKSALGQWKKFITECRDDRAKWCKAESHHQQKLLTPVLEAWSYRAQLMSDRRRIAEQGYRLHAHELLSECLEDWRVEARCLAVQRRRIEGFTENRASKLQLKVFTAWRSYSSDRGVQRQADEIKIDILHGKISKVYMQSAFSKWREARDKAVIFRLKYSQACIHHDRKLLKSTVSAWKQAVIKVKQIKMLKQQADIACEYRLQRKCYTVWRQRLTERSVEHEKTTLALLQWSLVLQRKCLIVWFYYAEGRKQKKQLYKEAMSKYKQKLVMEGLRQWMTVADSISQSREKIAADHHARHTHRTMLTVQRCFDHWRHKALSNKPCNKQYVPRLLVIPPAVSAQPIMCGTGSSLRKSPIKQRSPPKLFQMSVKGPIVAAKLDTSREPSPVKKRRPTPKQPLYLMQSLEREGLWKAYDEEQDLQRTEDKADPLVKILSEERSTKFLEPHSSGTGIPDNMMKCPPLARPEADDWLVTQPFSPERRPITPVTTVKSPNSLLKPSDFKQRMDGQAVIPPSSNHTPTLPQRADTEHSIYQSDGLGLLPPSAFVEVIRHTEITSPQCADSDTGSVISSSYDRGEGRDNTLADIQSLPADTPVHGDRGDQVKALTPPRQDYVAEIEEIRLTLLEYKSDRRRLRTLQEQCTTLTMCIDSLDEDDRRDADTEIYQLKTEISSLSADLRRRRELCVTLSDRLNTLSTLIH